MSGFRSQFLDLGTQAREKQIHLSVEIVVVPSQPQSPADHKLRFDFYQRTARDVEEAHEITERSSEDFALGFARWALGMALVHRESPAERERGLAVVGHVRDMCLLGRIYQYMLPVLDVYVARERARLQA